MNRITTNLARNHIRRGVAALEFAWTLPVFLILLICGVDAGIYMLTCQKIDRISYAVTDMVTQQSTLTKSDLTTIFSLSGELMKPLESSFTGMIIVSSIYKATTTGNPTTIVWQYSSSGSYTCGASSGCASHIGKTGATPTMPNNMTLNAGDNVITVEVFYPYAPLFAMDTVFTEKEIYRVAVYKPRLSALTTPPS